MCKRLHKWNFCIIKLGLITKECRELKEKKTQTALTTQPYKASWSEKIIQPIIFLLRHLCLILKHAKKIV